MSRSTKQAGQLAERDQRFVEEYCVDLCGTAAMRRIGFTGKRPDVAASKMLAKPAVAEAIRRRLADKSQRVHVDEAYVIQGLIEIRHLAQAQGRLDTAKGCVELLGKHLAMFTDKVKISDVEDLTDEQLDERIRRLSREAGITATTH